MSSKRLALRELAPIVWMAGLAVLVLFLPIPWPCAFRAVTGYPCPTCGMTRATHFALRGDFANATHMHPLWFIVLPALAGIAIGETIAFVRVRRWGIVVENKWVMRAAIAIGALLIGVWIARFFGAFGGPAPP